MEAGEEISTVDPKSLSIKIALPHSANHTSPSPPHCASSPYTSPLVSPPSSAFVSALQSPYISPRANSDDIPTPATTFSLTHPSPPLSYTCSSHSDDLPTTDDPSNASKLKIVGCVAETAPPRVSFSFPMPRISFASVSPASNAKLRSCDVYIGFHGQNPNLVRFCKWVKSELEAQGIASFVADRAKYADNQSHEIADRVICSVAFGLVVVTNSTMLNHLSLEEIRFFAQKKNLIPLFFDTNADEIASLFSTQAHNKESKEALDGLMRCHELKLESNDGNWRSCVLRAAGILRGKLGRKSVVEKEVDFHEELPFPRNNFIVGREKEILEIESAFFGCVEQESAVKGGNSDGLADGESEVDRSRGNNNYINLEAWVEPVGKNQLGSELGRKVRIFRMLFISFVISFLS